jgi:hypothetical protein
MPRKIGVTAVWHQGIMNQYQEAGMLRGATTMDETFPDERRDLI